MVLISVFQPEDLKKMLNVQYSISEGQKNLSEERFNEMNPDKVVRNKVKVITDLPNIAKEMEKYLLIIGIDNPSQLIGKSPYKMYEELCKKTGNKHDPCVIDVFLSITHFMNGDTPKPWWEYTKERKEDVNKKSHDQKFNRI